MELSILWNIKNQNQSLSEIQTQWFNFLKNFTSIVPFKFYISILDNINEIDLINSNFYQNLLFFETHENYKNNKKKEFENDDDNLFEIENNVITDFLIRNKIYDKNTFKSIKEKFNFYKV
jgi:hypothetical protein